MVRGFMLSEGSPPHGFEYILKAKRLMMFQGTKEFFLLSVNFTLSTTQFTVGNISTFDWQIGQKSFGRSWKKPTERKIDFYLGPEIIQ